MAADVPSVPLVDVSVDEISSAGLLVGTELEVGITSIGGVVVLGGSEVA